VRERASNASDSVESERERTLACPQSESCRGQGSRSLSLVRRHHLLVLPHFRTSFTTSRRALHRLRLLVSSLSRPLTTTRTTASAMSAPYASEQAIALSAVLKASLLAQKIQAELVGSGGVEKKDKSPVTGASRFLSLELGTGR